MNQLLITGILYLSLSITSQAQSSYSNYNGKKWEQISGNGKLVKLNPVVAAFTNLDINHMNARVIVEAGAAAFAIDVTIDENLKEFFRYKQEGTTLKLSFDLSGGKYPRWLSSNNTIVTIKVPSLESLNNKGNGNIEVKQLNQKTLKLTSSGNADISLSGTVNEVVLQTTGNSNINATELNAATTKLSSSGNADISVNTKELIEEKMNGNNKVSNRFYSTVQTNRMEKQVVPEFIEFALKNNSIFPAKVTLVSYRPDEEGNGTNSFVLIPYGSKRFRFPVGTKLYLADTEQVNTVMSGARISEQPPFLTVKKEDKRKTFSINQ
jgi:hypothetical protein